MVRSTKKNQISDATDGPGLSEFGNPYLFTGRRFDEKTGMYYYRNRYYEPRTGRFLSRDPLAVEGLSLLNLQNRYSYGRNNPTNLTDSSGLLEDQLWGDFATVLEMTAKKNQADNVTANGLLDCAKHLRAKGAEKAMKAIAKTLTTTPYKTWKLLSGEQILESLAKQAIKKLTKELKERMKQELEKFFEQWDCKEFSFRDENNCGCDIIFCYNAGSHEYKVQIEGLVSEDIRPFKRCCPPLKPYNKIYKGTVTEPDASGDYYTFTGIG